MFDGKHGREHNGVGFVEISKIFAITDTLFGRISFEKV